MDAWGAGETRNQQGHFIENPWVVVVHVHGSAEGATVAEAIGSGEDLAVVFFEVDAEWATADLAVVVDI